MHMGRGRKEEESAVRIQASVKPVRADGWKTVRKTPLPRESWLIHCRRRQTSQPAPQFIGSFSPVSPGNKVVGWSLIRQDLPQTLPAVHTGQPGNGLLGHLDTGPCCCGRRCLPGMLGQGGALRAATWLNPTSLGAWARGPTSSARQNTQSM